MARKSTRIGPSALLILFVLIGFTITALLSWLAWRTDRNTQHRLLRLQTRQAANAISAAILGIQNPLRTGAEIGAATDGDTGRFTRYMAAYTSTNGLFASASLWRIDGSTPMLVASSGSAPQLSPSSSTAQSFITRAVGSTTFAVTSINSGGLPRVGYALVAITDKRYVVYAERVIPENRRVAVEDGSEFDGIHFATYLGASTRTADMQTTDVPLNRLPLRGYTVQEEIPFGDTTLTLVTSPARQLGSGVEKNLPWFFLAGGVVLTGVISFFAQQLINRRRQAETNVRTITQLYDQLDLLYGEQRTISETLQHAVLPQHTPHIPALEIATRYIAGARGVDVGGDWYSVIALDDNRFGFVVGDVSGQGVDAVALMAKIRFTLRAYLLEGHSPDAALEMCSRQVDISEDGHMATVLVGLGDLSSREITFANAGHLNPLLVVGREASYVTTEVAPPLGVLQSSVLSTTVRVSPGSMLIAFTDGLVERRDEDIDTGLRRLAVSAAGADGPVEDILSEVITAMSGGSFDDDVAILAFRWT